MGYKKIKRVEGADEQKEALDYILKDISTLEALIGDSRIERANRLGIEQELCLVDRELYPSPVVLDALKHLDEDFFTTELARHNLEINLKPLEIKSGILDSLEQKLYKYIGEAGDAASKLNCDVMLIGILPTIRRHYISKKHMTPQDRFRYMIRAMNELRRNEYVIQIDGVERLVAEDKSNLFQYCNTSFQMHYQLDAENIPAQYNYAQLIAAPVLAAGGNSPYLLDKLLWHETRIALFQKAVDTRETNYHASDNYLRVPFGSKWLKESPLELYRDDLTRYDIFMRPAEFADSPKQYEEGEIPDLRSLEVFNSSVFRWNRLCYGVMNGKPHLRVENRLMPSGPTVHDEVANAAFWLGLMHGLPEKYTNLPVKMDFHEVKVNTIKAAQYGLDAGFNWINGENRSASELIRNELLPIAGNGLKKAGLAEEEIEKYLGVIHSRIDNGQTGSVWMINAHKKISTGNTPPVSNAILTSEILKRQKEGSPVHEWMTPDSYDFEIQDWGSLEVKKFMTDKVFTLSYDEQIDQAAYKMKQHDHCVVPVVDENWSLCGLLTSSDLMNYYREAKDGLTEEKTKLAELVREPQFTLNPDDSARKAANILDREKLKSLPVVSDNRLIGIVSGHDLFNVTKYAKHSEIES
ncbi:CBS domain-containing protein [Rhodohalobacter mucosus]|uniref:CBS domain-containing protein n=1 Tax=Rhodohalobacter mucosus TaxID=2079485 RepID=A0A316TW56_9BACT|nr:CBS domain-containing protein [Rhodohalobacter mucosus]PWN08178.1 hypothetical protein DDZ15_00660 [Rhodohalobacter mucosus]